MPPSTSLNGGALLSAAVIMASTILLASPVTLNSPLPRGVTDFADRGVLVDRHRLRPNQARTEVSAGGARLNERKCYAEGRDFLGGRLDKALDAPLGCMVEAETGIGHLAAFRRNLQNVTTALRAQMRQAGANDGDRTYEIGVDLMPELLFTDLLGGAKQTIAGVVDDDIDAPHLGEGAIDYPAHPRCVRHVQDGHPQMIAIPNLEVFKGGRLSNGCCYAIAPCEQLFGQGPSEASGSTCDEPVAGCHGVNRRLSH